MNEVSPLSHTNNNSNNSFCHQNHSPKSPIKEKSQERKDYEVVPKRELIVRYLHFKPWSGSFNLKELKDNGYYYKFYKEGGFVKIIKGILEENGFKVTFFLFSTMNDSSFKRKQKVRIGVSSGVVVASLLNIMDNFLLIRKQQIIMNLTLMIN